MIMIALRPALVLIAIAMMMGHAHAQQLCSSVVPNEQNCPVRPGDVERHCSFSCTGDQTWYYDRDDKIVMSTPGVRAMRTDTCVHVLEFYVQDCSVRAELGGRPKFCPPGVQSDRNVMFSRDRNDACRPKWNPGLGQ